MIPIAYLLTLGAILFVIGLAITITKQNIVYVLMGIELMLNGVNVNLVAFSRNDPSLSGQTFALFSMVIAAAEAVLLLAIILKAYKQYNTNQAGSFNELKETD
jgi:NADH:ubiquinone oxidoreductase subunit K